MHRLFWTNRVKYAMKCAIIAFCWRILDDKIVKIGSICCNFNQHGYLKQEGENERNLIFRKKFSKFGKSRNAYHCYF
uniref:Uncharacterized protein n=1 Tax=Onchocerca volvulus TaxID=6282 RepID=A0A8R1U1S3_ONCVO